MDWWREARFGMFVHWGLYAIPAGEWNGNKGHGEWIRDSAHIPIGTYEQFRPQWNPVLFDADAWAKMAAAAGMKYLVLTSKHHDGFCLFDSKATEWDVMNTPFGRDVCKELAAACARHGVRFCTYHSIMDWHHPDYLPRRPWEQAARPEGSADFARFEQYLHAQVTEVIEHYHPAVMWFDGEWERTWNHERGLRLFELCRRLAPDMIINNRVDVHRGGMGGFSGSHEAVGDFATPEQEIPATGIPGVDWESCMTMNSHWGWNQADTKWKSTKELLQNLIDIASKGGNYLLNIGPRADGTFPPQAVERLAAIGAWMQQNGEAISGTTASVFEETPWGRCTVRAGDATSTLYLHVSSTSKGSMLLPLPGLANEILSARVLGQRGSAAGGANHVFFGAMLGQKFIGKGEAVRLELTDPDPIATVVAVEIRGRPDVMQPPRVVAETDRFVHPIRVAIEQISPTATTVYTLDGTAPTRESPRADGPIHIDHTCVLKTASYRAGSTLSTTVVERTFTKVEPSPAVEPVAPNHGLCVTKHPGTWSKIPANREALAAATAVTVATVDIGKTPGEHVLLRFTGFLDVPKDELYRFALTSDDGSALWIDGQPVVDNDGLHGPVEKQGARALGQGLHPIEVVWFNQTGGAELKLRWAQPGGVFEDVPASALRY